MKLTARLLCIALLGASLAACSGLRTLSADVSTFGAWPADRPAGSYAFERLPSQEAQAQEQQLLEDAASGALKKAGFSAAAPGQQPDVLVQVGSRVSRNVSGAWDDPLWWRGGVGYWRPRPWGGPSWGVATYYPGGLRYEREVAVLIRERASSKPLYEARASHDSNTSGSHAALAALFDAALTDFPKTGINPHRVVVALPAS